MQLQGVGQGLLVVGKQPGYLLDEGVFLFRVGRFLCLLKQCDEFALLLLENGDLSRIWLLRKVLQPMNPVESIAVR